MKTPLGRNLSMVLFMLCVWPVQAADYAIGTLRVTQPWSRPTPPIATVGVVYLAIINRGAHADRLIAQRSPIAARVEIHESRKLQGMMEMRSVAAVECPPGATVKMEPGGLHIMLVGLLRPLAAGMDFPLELQFAQAGTMTVQVHVSDPP
jgi:copper(I)-binding protein